MSSDKHKGQPVQPTNEWGQMGTSGDEHERVCKGMDQRRWGRARTNDSVRRHIQTRVGMGMGKQQHVHMHACHHTCSHSAVCCA